MVNFAPHTRSLLYAYVFFRGTARKMVHLLQMVGFFSVREQQFSFPSLPFARWCGTVGIDLSSYLEDLIGEPSGRRFPPRPAKFKAGNAFQALPGHSRQVYTTTTGEQHRGC